MNTEGRPLSPHLTIYRWPITMTLSILHRITGVALSLGLVAWAVWLQAIAFETVPYQPFLEFSRSIVGRVLLLGWCFAFFFHFANGIRHLTWDTGRLFSREQARASSWVVLIAAIAMTAIYWLLVGR